MRSSLVYLLHLVILFAPHAVGKRVMGYIGTWALKTEEGGLGFDVLKLPAKEYTHIILSFATVAKDGSLVWDTKDGPVAFQNEYYDKCNNAAEPPAGMDGKGNLRGLYQYLFALKKDNPKLKIMLALGGWLNSERGHFEVLVNGTTDAAKHRTKLVQDTVRHVKNYGLDGIDVDWEQSDTYVFGPGHFAGLASLLEEMRAALPDYAELSYASAASPSLYKSYDHKRMNAALSFWNIMAYDYTADFWGKPTKAQAHANLYRDADCPKPPTEEVCWITPIDTDSVIADYVTNGTSRERINMGIPLYGRLFANASQYGGLLSGGPTTIFDNDTQKLAAASVNYSKLNISSIGKLDAKSKQIGAAYVTGYGDTKALVSFDNKESLNIKLDYIENESTAVGGVFFWQIGADRPIGDADNLMHIAYERFKDFSKEPNNHMDYPDSQYGFVRGKGDCTASDSPSYQGSVSGPATSNSSVPVSSTTGTVPTVGAGSGPATAPSSPIPSTSAPPGGDGVLGLATVTSLASGVPVTSTGSPSTSAGRKSVTGEQDNNRASIVLMTRTHMVVETQIMLATHVVTL